MIVPVRRNPNNGFSVATVHFTMDPNKNNEKWIAEAKKGLSEQAWNREYEIDYSSYGGKKFFPEFEEFNIAKHKIEYKRGETLYRGWDYGFHRPCCIITRLNQFDQWEWMKVILGEDEGIRAFGLRVHRYCLAEYPGAKYIDADDIAGKQKSDKSELSSREILNNIGIYPNSRKQEIRQGAEIIRQKLRMRVDGKPGILINQQETDIIDGFRGGLHYPETREGQTEKEFYHKDGYYDHIFDSARYIAVEMFTIIGQTQPQNSIIGQDHNKDTFAMGNPNYGEYMEEYDINEYF